MLCTEINLENTKRHSTELSIGWRRCRRAKERQLQRAQFSIVFSLDHSMYIFVHPLWNAPLYFSPIWGTIFFESESIILESIERKLISPSLKWDVPFQQIQRNPFYHRWMASDEQDQHCLSYTMPCRTTYARASLSHYLRLVSMDIELSHRPVACCIFSGFWFPSRMVSLISHRMETSANLNIKATSMSDCNELWRAREKSQVGHRHRCCFSSPDSSKPEWDSCGAIRQFYELERFCRKEDVSIGFTFLWSLQLTSYYRGWHGPQLAALSQLIEVLRWHEIHWVDASTRRILTNK